VCSSDLERTEQTVIAAFRNNKDAEAAADALRAEGFSPEPIYGGSGSSPAGAARTSGTTHEGGIKGWLKSIFGEDENPDREGYERAYQQGQCLLRVDVDDEEIDTVEAVLNRFSPIDIQTEDQRVDTSRSASAGSANTSEQAIPVVREDLQVGKRQVLRGGVRIYSRVVSQPVEENISLRQERVRVDRRPVNREATAADLNTGRDEVIEVQEFAEEPVIAKQARVVEEVRVGKDVSARNETIRDNVRHTEVNVESTGTGNGAYDNDDAEFRSHFQSQYGGSGASYDTYLPAYQYGSTMAADPRFEGRSYSDVEAHLRSGYSSRNPQSTWEQVKDAVRHGWDKVANKSKAAVR